MPAARTFGEALQAVYEVRDALAATAALQLRRRRPGKMLQDDRQFDRLGMFIQASRGLRPGGRWGMERHVCHGSLASESSLTDSIRRLVVAPFLWALLPGPHGPTVREKPQKSTG